MNLLSRLARDVLPPLVLFAGVVFIWGLAVWALSIPAYLLPAPWAVAQAAWMDAGRLLSAMGLTFTAALCGFAASLVLGTLISFAFAQSALVRRCGYPYAIFLQTVPIVAIAPLVIAICGQNLRSVVLVSTIISLFPIITNVTTGLLAVDPRLTELFAVYRATRWQRLTKLQIPTAVPHLVTGAKVSSGLAMVGAIVGEFFAGYGQERYGLGFLIQANSDTLRTDRLIAAVFASALLGVAMFTLVATLSRWALKRWLQA